MARSQAKVHLQGISSRVRRITEINIGMREAGYGGSRTIKHHSGEGAAPSGSAMLRAADYVARQFFKPSEA